MNKQEVFFTGYFSELKSSISEMEKELSKLQVMKHEYQECCSVLNDECTRLKESEVSINLLSVLLNNLTEWYDTTDCGNGDNFHLRIMGFWISPLT